MKRRIILLSAALIAFAAFAAAAADLTVDMQVNTTAKDYANNYITFKGLVSSVERDQFAPGADATSGASKLFSTEVFNAYRFDVKGKAALPSALRYFMLYAVANDGIRVGDNMNVTKAASGVITIRFVHRGYAFEIVTDSTGKVVLPTTSIKLRVIGATDNTISPDFSTNGKTTGVDWAKVWDTSIADGKVIGTTNVKTSKVMNDIADSTIYLWTGAYQFSYDGKILKMTASLDAVKK